MNTPEARLGALVAPAEGAEKLAARVPVRRMKIAFVVHDYHCFGGHSRYVAELATRLSRDHEVHVFANRIEHDGTPGIQFHKVPAWRANALTTVLTFALPIKFLVGRNFDIVHCQGFCGFLGNVFTAHVCNRAWDVAVQKLGGGRTTRERVFNLITSSLEYILYRFGKGSTVIAVSERVRRDLITYYRCPAHIDVVHHGTDLQLFSPEVRAQWRAQSRREFGLPQNAFVFLYVGHLRKGARQCIEALAKVPAGHLLCVSATDPAPYRQIAERCGVADRVVFAPHTKQVEKVFAAGDAKLLPSPYDSFALVVTEAMACGLPVLVSREAGVSELIEDGVNGLLLNDVTSVDELARHMRSLQDNAAWADRLGRAGRATVENYTWDRVAEQTCAIFENALETRQRTRMSHR